jgi:phosphoribosylformylglycinamidine synthase subunit PurL
MIETTDKVLASEPEVTAAQAEAHGLSVDEFERIRKLLGRTPTYTELGVYSVMWSEHCSYKNSVALLKTFPRESKSLLAQPGEENAGAVDIGDDLGVVFKIESHNHPSAVEPYQGAATGVGGILRDVFTMGARPVAVLDSLRFGPLDVARNRYLVDGVVRGVGDYGNCFGVPNIGGEVQFAAAYSGNPLVNAMAIGIVRRDKLARARAERPGATVLLVGSSTGRDGIHGATFASEELTEASEARRPSVQIGDPFAEKLLLEATLEVIDRDLIIGIQDMGAAGITCSCSEMAARGGCGIEIEATRVPMREERMTPYEVLLSESQERMLVVVEPKYESEVISTFERWGIHSRPIGRVTDDGQFRVTWNGEVVCNVPARSLVLGGGAPVYVREQKRPDYLDRLAAMNPEDEPEPGDLAAAVTRLLAAPNVSDKSWVTEQYDQTVRTSTAIRPGGDAGLLRLRESRQGLAAATDGKGRYCYINPRLGALHTVFESARNVAAVGARPVGITNCLNFGNPYKPEMYYTFAECVAGIGEACRALEIPVTGGNVSFYNEVPEAAVYPTPVIGMLGLLEDVDLRVTVDFKQAGDLIFVVGEWPLELGGSEYYEAVCGKIGGRLPALDLQAEKRTLDFVVRVIDHGLIRSCHDVSDGGTAVALCECALRASSPLGFEVAAPVKGRTDAVWFGEGGGRFIITAWPERADRLVDLAYDAGVTMHQIGRVSAGDFKFDQHSLRRGDAKTAYFDSLRKLLATTADVE